jgi:hypothetical protein
MQRDMSLSVLSYVPCVIFGFNSRSSCLRNRHLALRALGPKQPSIGVTGLVVFRITEVDVGRPAAKAGLQKGDQVYKMRAVNLLRHFVATIAGGAVENEQVGPAGLEPPTS